MNKYKTYLRDRKNQLNIRFPKYCEWKQDNDICNIKHTTDYFAALSHKFTVQQNLRICTKYEFNESEFIQSEIEKVLDKELDA